MTKTKVLILVDHQYDDLELYYPQYRLLEEGYQVILAASKAQETYLGKRGYSCLSDTSFQEIQVGEFAGIVIPGGHAPDRLRTYPKVLEIVSEFHRQRKTIGFICHGGSVAISARVLSGVQCTSYPGIKDDLSNAGAKWVDAPVVQDQHFISSRTPRDLPFFCPALLKSLASTGKIKT